MIGPTKATDGEHPFVSLAMGATGGSFGPISVLWITAGNAHPRVRGALMALPREMTVQLTVVSSDSASSHLLRGTPDVVLCTEDVGLADVTALAALDTDIPWLVGSPGLVGLKGPGLVDALPMESLDAAELARSLGYATRYRRLARQMREILMSSRDGVLAVDRKGDVVFANPVGAEMFGSSVKELLGRPLGIPVADRLGVELALGEHRIAEMNVVDGEWNGRPVYMVALRDVTLRKRAERLEHLVNRDPMTRALNRRGLEEVLAKETSRSTRFGTPLSALLLDCDDFKAVNDTFGHAMGDGVLVRLVDGVTQTLRSCDSLARIGGDEFVVLLPDTRLADAWPIAERVRLAVSAAASKQSGPGRISASVGLCRVPQGVTSVEELLGVMRVTLQSAKAGGKNRVSALDGELGDPSLSLDDFGCISTWAQPIVSMDGEGIIAWEFLSRALTKGFENPDDFFRVCQERNVLGRADLLCLRGAMHAAQLIDSGHRGHVNLFPSTLFHTPARALLDLFAGGGGAERFCLEISEKQVVEDPERLVETLLPLRRAGLSIGIDDVGFGRTSLEVLVMVEPDVVKLDGRLVRAAATAPGPRRALERLVGVVTSLGALLIAEGVEDTEHVALVRSLGIPQGQGFFWGRPRLMTPAPFVA